MGQGKSTLAILPEQRRKQIQKVVGNFLFYGWAADPMILLAL